MNHEQVMAQLQAELLLIQNMSDAEGIKHGIDREAALESVHNAMMVIDNVTDEVPEPEDSYNDSGRIYKN